MTTRLRAAFGWAPRRDDLGFIVRTALAWENRRAGRRTRGRDRCPPAGRLPAEDSPEPTRVIAQSVSSPCDCQSGARMPRSCSAVLSRNSKSLKDADCLSSAID